MLKSSITLVAILIALPYACAPIYRFPTARPFAGSSLYNPYRADQPHAWHRANFHAHGRAWGGWTSASQTGAEVVAAYRSRGYDVAALSDYQDIAAQPGSGAIPVYEHGYNTGKHHQLAIGASRVLWFDFPVWQGVHEKQYVINRLRQTTALIALAHPTALSGYSYSEDDLRRLTGYHLMEVLNGQFTAEVTWDAALSAGRVVWAIGNDDTHDISDPDRFAVAWNMIEAPSTRPADILAALSAGRTYAALKIDESEEPEIKLSSVEVRDGVVTVTCTGPPADFSFVGQNGVVKKTIDAASSATYTFAADDSYVRAVVTTSTFALYLNPIIRYDGALPASSASIDPVFTALRRIGIVGACVILLVFRIWRHTSSRRRIKGPSLPRVASLVMMIGLSIARPAHAQDPTRSPFQTTVLEGVPLTSVFNADLLAALPTADSVFSTLETMHAETISSRVSGGGIGFGSAPRLGTFGSSPTQTRFRVGDVNITDPSAHGTPFVVPELLFWQSVSVGSGLPSGNVNPAASIVTLEPRRPASRWTGSVEGSSSFGDALTARVATPAPAIARLTGWNRASVLASGPLGSGRSGLVFAGAWTGSSQSDRGQPQTSESDVASAFANVVVAASDHDEIRTSGWVQRSVFPAARRALFADPAARLGDTSIHVQSTWAHDDRAGTPWRVFAGYSHRDRTPQSTLSRAATIDRLLNGAPFEHVIETAARTDGRLSAGARATRTAGARRPHTIEAGLDLDVAQSSIEPGFTGVVGELIDGLPSRLWQYAAPPLTSDRHSISAAAFASDRFAVGARGWLNLALRFERFTASADGASQGVAWSTLLPRARFQWTVSPQKAVRLFVDAGRSAYELPLDHLAWGDPASPSAEVYRWSGSATVLTPTSSARLFSAGPGGVSRIDSDLSRPYSNDLFFGVEGRPAPGITVQLGGICSWERQLLGIVNVANPAPAYSFVTVNDPGIDLANPVDDQTLPASNLLLPTTPYRFDYVLTNPTDGSARRLGLKLTAELISTRLYMLFGATAYLADGIAARRGFESTENDQGLVGDVWIDPNAGLFARGRLFGDRAFTGKWTTVYRLPSNVTVGAVARYQDGQPFTRLLVVPSLNQGADVIRAYPNGNHRFTFTATLDVRVQRAFAIGGRRLAVLADAYNLLGLDEEVEERVVTGPGFRTPTAMQPPRSFRVGARIVF